MICPVLSERSWGSSPLRKVVSQGDSHIQNEVISILVMFKSAPETWGVRNNMILPKVPNTPVKESEDINMDEIMSKQRVHKIAFFFF